MESEADGKREMRERERESGGARVFCEVYLSIFFFFGLVRIEIFFGEGFKWIFFSGWASEARVSHVCGYLV